MKSRITKGLSLIISVIIIFTTAGCRENENTSSSEPEKSVSDVVASASSQEVSSQKAVSQEVPSSSEAPVSSQKDENVVVSTETSSKETDSQPDNTESSSEEYTGFVEDFKYYTVPIFNWKDINQETYYDPISGYTIPYCLILPEEYDLNKKYPLILYLHGAGERGSDNETQLRNMITDTYNNNAALFDQAILVAPQCPSNDWWNIYINSQGQATGALGGAMNLLNRIEKDYSCDQNRIYVMGISMGGYATWNLLSLYSEKFAGGIPICGWGDTLYASVLADVPIWIYHGLLDTTVSCSSSQIMYDAIIKAGGTKVKFTIVNDAYHSVWEDAAYDTELFKWLFEQRLEGKGE